VEAAVVKAAERAAAEVAARQRRLNPLPEDYPDKLKPPDR